MGGAACEAFLAVKKPGSKTSNEFLRSNALNAHNLFDEDNPEFGEVTISPLNLNPRSVFAPACPEKS